MPDSIFKAYDIRGKYPKEINKITACLIGQAFINFVKDKVYPVKSAKLLIVIGQDLRKSSPTLFKGLIKGISTLRQTNIIDIGKVPIDAFYFAVEYFKADGGIMITASHNPLTWNGFKMIVKNYGFICQGQGMEELELRVENQPSHPTGLLDWITGQKSKIYIKSVNIIPNYLNHIFKLAKKLDFQPIPRSLKIGLEFLGGTASKIIKPLAKKLFLKTIYLNSLVDPSDPLLSKNLKRISKTIKKKKLDFGVSFDGDGDRCVFLDEKGKIIDPSMILVLFSLFFLEKFPHSKIVYNLVCSKIVKETIKKHGGIPIRCPVGHVFIKKIAAKNHAVFGGEHSAHFFWKENNYSECPSLALLLMIQILSRKKQKLSKLIKPFKKYYKGTEIDLSSKKFSLTKMSKNFKKLVSYFRGRKIDPVRRSQTTSNFIPELRKNLRSEPSNGVDYLDGLTIEFPDWWFNLRPSRTESIFKLVIEAENKKMFLEKKKKILSLLTNLRIS